MRGLGSQTTVNVKEEEEEGKVSTWLSRIGRRALEVTHSGFQAPSQQSSIVDRNLHISGYLNHQPLSGQALPR